MCQAPLLLLAQSVRHGKILATCLNNLSLASQFAMASTSSLALGVSGRGIGSFITAFGSSNSTSGFTFSFTVTASKNWTNQILNFHGESLPKNLLTAPYDTSMLRVYKYNKI